MRERQEEDDKAFLNVRKISIPTVGIRNEGEIQKLNYQCGTHSESCFKMGLRYWAFEWVYCF